MKTVRNLLAACVPALVLAACGGGDSLDIAEPGVRLVHASPIATDVSLVRESDDTVIVADAAYPYASDYIDVDSGLSDWTVRTVVGDLVVDTVTIDAEHGKKYSVIVAPDSPVTNGAYLVVDPYEKPLGSDSTRLRAFNATYATGAIDVYMTAVGTNIAGPGVNPLIAGVEAKTAGPASGDDSADLPAGDFQVTLAAAGTKTILFTGKLSIGPDRDLLMVVVPIVPVPGGIQDFAKIEGDPGMTEVMPCADSPSPPIPVCS